MDDVRRKPAEQQPAWPDAAHIERVRTDLANRPALVRPTDIDLLRSLLAEVADGKALVIQSGDCAEDPAESTPSDIARKKAVLDLLAGSIGLTTHRPVIRVGRIAGQFAKPRSASLEQIAGVELPVYRGHLVNSPEPDPAGRRPDPDRLLTCYQAASKALVHLGWREPGCRSVLDAPVWTSHEALVLDYELPLVRPDTHGRLFLTSTHWPWIGERTRQVDGAHVALLSLVANPVACKIGPNTTVDELRALCERLDPHRQKGRLTLTVRMGPALPERLGPLVRAVRSAGHPAIWLSDPMHGNTVFASDGLKTRFVESILREVRDFQSTVRAEGGIAGGLHLETTPDEVTECVHDDSEIALSGRKYTSLCDPRLNPAQALSVVSAWRG
jgi:3-deoxy-7-phosphoheptulonate synthase